MMKDSSLIFLCHSSHCYRQDKAATSTREVNAPMQPAQGGENVVDIPVQIPPAALTAASKGTECRRLFASFPIEDRGASCWRPIKRAQITLFLYAVQPDTSANADAGSRAWPV
ncbi:MAG: hypothetical protein ABWY00_13280, partial [Dongiaceae bacterium]